MEKIIEFCYNEAVKDIKEEWLSPSSTKWHEHIVSLNEKLQAVYLISVLNQQVFNGGFDQYFINGYGQFSFETIYFLEKIQAKELASIVKQAYDKVNSENLDEESFRKKLLKGEIESLYSDSQLAEYLDLLTDQYLNKHSNLEELLVNFIKDA